MLIKSQVISTDDKRLRYISYNQLYTSIIVLYDARTVFRNVSDTFSSRPLVVYFEWMCDLISRMFRTRVLSNNESSPKTFNY